MLEEGRVLRSEGWRNELRETLAELRNEPSLSLKDQRIIQRSIRGFLVPVKDDARETNRLGELLLQLAETKSQIAATLAAGDME